MSNKQIYFIGALVIILFYYSKKLEAAQNLTVRYLLPQNIRISNGAIMWNQPFVITNPTLTPINLNRYNVQVQLENYPIGTAYGASMVKVLAGTETTILANVVVPLDALISSIPDILRAGKSLDFRFVGQIVAEFLTVPIDTKINVPIPKIVL